MEMKLVMTYHNNKTHNFITGTSFINKFPKTTANEELEDSFGANLIILVSLIFKTNLLAVNQFTM
jgi:hypothetical protein